MRSVLDYFFLEIIIEVHVNGNSDSVQLEELFKAFLGLPEMCWMHGKPT